MRNGEARTDRNALVLAGLRIAVGCVFLIFGQNKVFGTQFTLQGGFAFFIHRWVQSGAAYPFFVPVLQKIALPHPLPVAFLVAYGELAIGLALVSGVWLRIASAFGLVYMLALLFSSNYPGAHSSVSDYLGVALDHAVLAICFVCFLIARPEERFSAMRILRRWTGRTSPDPAV
ncbi:MAG TPA: DoxX family protein [Terracidiphilus sp.]|jgi:thiosulfate dehydrogenase [quinone] large subunit